MSATMDDQPSVVLPPAGSCLGDWRGWWLSTHCRCGAKIRSIDHMLEARAIPAWMLMPMVVERLRCAHCRERPRQAELEWGPADRGHAPLHLSRTAILVPVLEDVLQS
jgi:hypothetical protein